MIHPIRIINKLIEEMGYDSFCEIGYANGSTHEQIKCKKKIGVDPKPININPNHIVTVTTSDKFFEQNNNYYDIYLIDGEHSYKQVFKDILNALNWLSPNGCLFLHDICPWREELCSESCSGDGFKAFMQLRTEKPDIYMTVLNEWYTQTDETGFGIIFKDKQELWTKDIEYTWKFMNSNRRELMNVQNFDDVLNKLKGKIK